MHGAEVNTKHKFNTDAPMLSSSAPAFSSFTATAAPW